MSGQAGHDVEIRLADPSIADGYVMLAGLRTRELSLTADTLDATHLRSPGGWQQRLEGAGLRRARLRGHWLNGRGALITLSEIITDLASLIQVEVDTSALAGVVDGYSVSQSMPLRAALAPLMTRFDLVGSEQLGALRFMHRGSDQRPVFRMMEPVDQSVSRSRSTLDKIPRGLALRFISADGDYAPAIMEARGDPAGLGDTLAVNMPMALSNPAAIAMAESLLGRLDSKSEMGVSLGPEALPLLIGDRVEDEEGVIRYVVDMAQSHWRRDVTLAPLTPSLDNVVTMNPPEASPVQPPSAAPLLLVIDGPALPSLGAGPLLACTADPWPGPISVSAGLEPSRLQERAVCRQEAQLGRLFEDAPAGPEGRWDRHTVLELEWFGDALESVSEAAAMAGENVFLLETEFGWEVVSAVRAIPLGDSKWQLRTLLRGLFGSLSGAAMRGARIVKVGPELVTAAIAPSEQGLEMFWQAGQAAEVKTIFDDVAGLSWRPAHLRVTGIGDNEWCRWTVRCQTLPTSWARPEAANTGRFEVKIQRLDGQIQRHQVNQAAFKI
ncbi:MAG: phage tail tube protein [Pseudomonadota bacterium]